ncbi:serine hydrolase [Qipengyuania sediminis]|uniref:serine hydrolase n=1 Tax=Qipengyuania sediminis TaxID=1532023 RepID=UPI00105A3556|nr:serine hydrolase [Qipengyuania sediminis]
MGLRTAFVSLAATLSLALPASAFAQAQQAHKHSSALEAQFDSALGTASRVPLVTAPASRSALAQRVAELANASAGRIGVAALDLTTGETVGVLADQRFPLASTSKIAVAATFLEGVEQGRWRLDQAFPLLHPTASRAFSTSTAPVVAGQSLPARELIEQMIVRSSNPATDALLRVVGGPKAVNAWMRRAGIRDFSIDRDIATLVRDDGEFNPAHHIDRRDSATPNAMVQLLAGIYQGKLVAPASRQVILGAMSRTVTGKRRIRALIPAGARVLHKTGTLSGTASDIGFIETPEGHTLAIAIYVTGQGTKPARDAKIAAIARGLYDGYGAAAALHDTGRAYASASYGAAGGTQ